MDAAEHAWIAEATGARDVRRGERIQSLWSGYGEIFRAELTGATASHDTAIVKSVKPPARLRASAHDASHARKCRSYDIEMAFYRTFAARCDVSCRVPALIASRAANGEWLFVLEDLDAAGFAERRRDPTGAHLEACLAWLASFHARFMGVRPEGLWKTGTYWHLATRPDELAAIDDVALREAAPILDKKLRAASFQTFVHGDAKPDNFCFTRGPRPAVAAVDFQYVGGGCGMKDVAYLLNGGSTDAHVDTYFRHLRASLDKREDPIDPIDARAVEREWRALYPIACADYYRFIAGWAKDHWKRDREGQRLTREVLSTLAST